MPIAACAPAPAASRRMLLEFRAKPDSSLIMTEAVSGATSAKRKRHGSCSFDCRDASKAVRTNSLTTGKVTAVLFSEAASSTSLLRIESETVNASMRLETGPVTTGPAGATGGARTAEASVSSAIRSVTKAVGRAIAAARSFTCARARPHAESRTNENTTRTALLRATTGAETRCAGRWNARIRHWLDSVRADAARADTLAFAVSVLGAARLNGCRWWRAGDQPEQKSSKEQASDGLVRSYPSRTPSVLVV